MLLLALPAFAIDLPQTPNVRPFVWARPGYVWIADDPANPTDQDGFVAEARLGVEASFADLPVKGKVELALLPEPTLTDAYLEVDPVAWLELRAGQMKPPISVQKLASDTRRQLPNNVTFLDEAELRREIGVDATVAVPLADRVRARLSSGIYNGEGANRVQNVNQRFKLVERVLITPFGARRTAFEGTGRELYVGVGGGWIYDYAGEGLSASESNTYALELQAAYDVISLQAEALDQEIVHANPALADYHVKGVYGQLGSFVPAPWARDHVELVVRVEYAEPNTAFGAEAGEAQADLQSTRRITGGVTWYVRAAPERAHDLKLQAAYTNAAALEGEDPPDDSFTLSATARF